MVTKILALDICFYSRPYKSPITRTEMNETPGMLCVVNKAVVLRTSPAFLFSVLNLS